MIYEVVTFDDLPGAVFEHDGKHHEMIVISRPPEVELRIPGIDSRVGGRRPVEEGEGIEAVWWLDDIVVGNRIADEGDDEAWDRVQAYNEGLRGRGFGTRLMAGFLLMASMERAQFVDLSVDDTTLFSILGRLVGEQRVSYYVKDRMNEQRTVIVMDMEEATRRTEDVLDVLDACAYDGVEPDGPVERFFTRVDLGDLAAEEHARLYDAYLGPR